MLLLACAEHASVTQPRPVLGQAQYHLHLVSLNEETRLFFPGMQSQGGPVKAVQMHLHTGAFSSVSASRKS